MQVEKPFCPEDNFSSCMLNIFYYHFILKINFYRIPCAVAK